MPVHDVLNDELNLEVLQKVVGRNIAGIITQREIEQIKSGHDVGVIADGAGEGAAANRATCRYALIVDDERRRVVMEPVGSIVHEAGDAPRPAAPAQARARSQT